MAPDVPMPTPMSAEPEITACSVSPAPCVPKFSSSMPCFWKIPACIPSVGIWFAQASICPIATLILSCADADVAASASGIANASARRIMIVSSLRRNLQELGQLFLAQRRIEELERDRILHGAVEIGHLLRLHRRLGVKLLERLRQDIDRLLHLLGVHLQRLRVGIHPVDRLAI